METTLTDIRQGGCLCGAVRYRAHGEPLRTLVCHCRFCQKMTGSTSYAESMFPVEAVEIDGALGTYAHLSQTSGKAVHLHFCPRCATVVTLTFDRWPQYRAVSRGTLDDPDSVEIGSHIWTESAQSGVVVPGGVDCFRHARALLDGTPLEPTRHPGAVEARGAA